VLIFDTSFLVSFHNEDDSNHPSARDGMQAFLAGEWGPGLLLEYVAVETMTVMAARRGLGAAVRVGRQLVASNELEFVPCADLFADTFERFSAQKRFRLSFTDCAILVAAERRGATRVATFDADFRREKAVRVVPGRRR